METPVAEVAEVAEVAKVADVTEAVEEAEEPPTPSHRKKVEMATRPPALDADFWGGMLNTKRAMDKAATSLRYSNLVVLK
mgnify:CR=1 FL=1